MSESLLPTPVDGHMRSGLRRALRAAALAPVIAGTLTFVTAGLVRAEDGPTPEPPTEEPTGQEPTSQEPTSQEPTSQEPTSDAPSNEELPADGPSEAAAPTPTVESVVARPGGLTVTFLPAEGSSPLFHVVMAKVGDEVVAKQVVLGDVRTASLSGLENGVEHDVVVFAIDLLGIGDLSPVFKATPLADGSAVIAPLAVEDVEVVRSKHSATVSWSAPANDGGSAIQAFVVNAVDQSTGKTVIWRTLPADVRSAAVAPLAHGVAYDINVFAVSGLAFGAVETVSDVLGSNALENPVAPTLPWASAYAEEDGDVFVNWGAAVEHGVPVTQYHAVVVQDGLPVGWSVTDADARSVIVQGLDAAEDAEVWVFTASPIGFGEVEVIELPAPPAEV